MPLTGIALVIVRDATAVTVIPLWPNSRQAALLPTQWSPKAGVMNSEHSSRYETGGGRIKRKSYLPSTRSAELSLRHLVSPPRSEWGGEMMEKSSELELTGRGKGGRGGEGSQGPQASNLPNSPKEKWVHCICVFGLSNLSHFNCSWMLNSVSIEKTRKKKNNLCIPDV